MISEAPKPRKQRLIAQAVARSELKWRKLKSKSCRYFIEKYVHIKDPDVDSTVTRFKLWPGQVEALDAIINNRLTVVLKARQLGLTWLALSYIVWMLLLNVGKTAVAVSRTENDAKKLVTRIELILRHMPTWLVSELTDKHIYSRIKWESTATFITIYHQEGEVSTFESLTSSPNTGRSLTANIVLLDEWAFQQFADEIWSSAYPTINRPTGGQVIGLSTAKRGTLFEEVWTNAIKGINRFKTVFLSWRTDPRRDDAWYEDTKLNMPTSYLQEYPSTPEEAFSAGEGAAFPEFSRTVHVCKPFRIPEYWKRWRSNDPGYTDPFAWYWFAASEDGQVFMYREYTRIPADPKVVYSDQAREVDRLSVMVDEDGEEQKEQHAFIVTGRDAFNKHPETGKSIEDYYIEGGLKNFLEPPRNQKTDRIFRKAVLHEYLRPYKDENTGEMTAKLQIFSTCTRIIETLPSLENDPNDPEKVKECSIDHNYDAVGYGLVAWHAKVSKAPEPEKSTIAKHKESRAKRALDHQRRRIGLS